MHTSLPTRAGIAGAAVTGLLALTMAPASASPSSDSSAHFLTAQLSAGGDHLSVAAGGQTYADFGLTIDAILALDSAKTGQSEAAKAASYVVKNGGDYVGTGTESYVGGTAKALLMTQAQGIAPTVGGENLLTALKGLEKPSGQFADKSAYGDYSNLLSQSFALIALKRAGSTPDAAAVNFLVAQQCADGGFRLNYTGACTSDPDATAVAVQALVAVGKTGAADKAANYLVGKQNSSGAIGGAGPTSGVNSNTTGLAAVALSLTGQSAAAAKASAWVRSMQFGCNASTVMRGGIAYDAAAKSANASRTTPTDQDVRATAQATLGLTLTSYNQVAAGGSAVAPALNCTPSSNPAPTSSAPAPTSSAPAPSSSAPAGQPTGTVSGPVVVTDGPSGGTGDNATVLGVGGGVLAAVIGSVAVYARRRR